MDDDELYGAIVRIIELNVIEVGAEGLESGEILGADTAAEQILKLLEERMSYAETSGMLEASRR